MKKMSIVVAFVTAVALAFAACGKKTPPPAAPAATEGSAAEGSDMGSAAGSGEAGSGSAM